MTSTPPLPLPETIIWLCDREGWTDPVSLTRGAIGSLTGATAPGITLPEGCEPIAQLITMAYGEVKDAGQTAWLIYILHELINR